MQCFFCVDVIYTAHSERLNHLQPFVISCKHRKEESSLFQQTGGLPINHKEIYNLIWDICCASHPSILRFTYRIFCCDHCRLASKSKCHNNNSFHGKKISTTNCDLLHCILVSLQSYINSLLSPNTA